MNEDFDADLRLRPRTPTLRPFFRRPIVMLYDCEVCEEQSANPHRDAALRLCDDCYNSGVENGIIDRDGFFPH